MFVFARGLLCSSKITANKPRNHTTLESQKDTKGPLMSQQDGRNAIARDSIEPRVGVLLPTRQEQGFAT